MFRHSKKHPKCRGNRCNEILYRYNLRQKMLWEHHQEIERALKEGPTIRIQSVVRMYLSKKKAAAILIQSKKRLHYERVMAELAAEEKEEEMKLFEVGVTQVALMFAKED